VEKVEIVQLDAQYRHIPNTEFSLQADTVCLATGLTPLTELAWIAGCKFQFIPALGGHIPIHDGTMRTTEPNIYVAGDISGIEEASTAMEEGRLAGINAAAALERISVYEAAKRSAQIWENLNALRCGQFGQKRRDAKDMILKTRKEMIV
jgi:pyruvate/2-oxoglutarate dehydrogenase complex dihydrolipoamide dehydrogenase (E3) component